MSLFVLDEQTANGICLEHNAHSARLYVFPPRPSLETGAFSLIVMTQMRCGGARLPSFSLRKNYDIANYDFDHSIGQGALAIC